MGCGTEGHPDSKLFMSQALPRETLLLNYKQEEKKKKTGLTVFTLDSKKVKLNF